VASINSNNLSLDRGRADFDQKHVVTATWIYELPFGEGRKYLNSGGTAGAKVLRAVAGGWQIQGLNAFMSGEPYSISSGSATAFYSASTSTPNGFSRAVQVGPAPTDGSLSSKAGVIGPVFFQDASAFAVPAPGQTGGGRNQFNGPHYWDMDMAIAKNFNFTERVKGMFRLEAFNALNHPNFRRLQNASVGSTNILSPNFGVAGNQTLATATSTAIVSNGEAYRVAQLVLRVSF
jgi:hypothetical protein